MKYKERPCSAFDCNNWENNPDICPECIDTSFTFVADVELPSEDICGDETYAIFYTSDEAFCNWFTCFRCGDSHIREESNYCPHCGRKIKILF